MKIELPDKTAADLRAMLDRLGDDSDLESYVQRTLAKRLLFETIAEIRRGTAGVDPAELQAAIDEAVKETRAARRSKGLSADRS